MEQNEQVLKKYFLNTQRDEGGNSNNESKNGSH